MSARTNLKYALDGNRRLDGLIVFDPPMVPPKDHPLYGMMHTEERVLWRWSAGRPGTFDDPSEMAPGLQPGAGIRGLPAERCDEYLAAVG